MLTNLKPVALAAFIAASLAVSALANADSKNELEPLQAYTIASESHTAVVYYTRLDNGLYQVVTTVGSNPGVPGSMAQHRVTLEEGQSYSFALDQGLASDDPESIQITALSDSIHVAHR